MVAPLAAAVVAPRSAAAKPPPFSHSCCWPRARRRPRRHAGTLARWRQHCELKSSPRLATKNQSSLVVALRLARRRPAKRAAIARKGRNEGPLMALASCAHLAHLCDAERPSAQSIGRLWNCSWAPRSHDTGPWRPPKFISKHNQLNANYRRKTKRWTADRFQDAALDPIK